MKNGVQMQVCDVQVGSIIVLSFLLVFIISPDLIRSFSGGNACRAWILAPIRGLAKTIQASDFYEIAKFYSTLMLMDGNAAHETTWRQIA